MGMFTSYGHIKEPKEKFWFLMILARLCRFNYIPVKNLLMSV